MPQVFVSIGSNVEREKNLQAAIDSLHSCYVSLTLSRVYESAAIGFSGSNFYNLVVALDTDEAVEGVAARLANIEETCGRRRTGNSHEPRTLDLDLLLYGDLRRHDDKIDIPRDEIRQYAFVLRPLAEVAPEFRHPEIGMTIGEMWRNFRDRNHKLWPAPFNVER